MQVTAAVAAVAVAVAVSETGCSAVVLAALAWQVAHAS